MTAAFRKPLRYDASTYYIYDARGRPLINVFHAHLAIPNFHAFGEEIVHSVNEYRRLALALRALSEAVIEENGNLGAHGEKMRNALRLASAALAGARRA